MLAALLALALAASPHLEDGSTAQPAAGLLARIAVMGSSASNGFGLTREVGRPVSLGDVLDQALVAPHELVADATNSMFFMSPENVGEQLLEDTLAARPTLVVAVDYLFWFAYGYVQEEQRPALFERGLANLDRVECTLLVGDLPDMSSAIGGGMLLEPQVPKAATLEALNARLAAWAAERERVHVVPVARFVAERAKGGALRFGHLVVPEEQAADLLQPDRLHPNLRGSASLALLALDSLAGGDDDLSTGLARWDVAEVAERVRLARSPEREGEAPREPEHREKTPERSPERERAGTLR